MSIKLDLKIFLFLFLFLLTSQIEMYIILMVFAIIHELGHLIAGLILKFKPEEIKLSPVGLQISFKVEPEEYNTKVKKANPINIRKVASQDVRFASQIRTAIRNLTLLYRKKSNDFSYTIKKAILALAGPFTNLLISTILILVGKFNLNLQSNYIYQIIIYSNFLIAMFNLIPIYPMDGGRFLNELLKIFVGNKKAYKITYITSKTILIILTAMSSIAILYIHNIAIVIILAYLWYLEIIEIRRYNRRKNIERLVKTIEAEKVKV